MIRFSFIKDASAIHGELAYYKSEYSFVFKPQETTDFLERVGKGSAPLVVDHYLQIEVSVETGYLLYVHGLHGHHRWKQKSLPIIQSTTGIVKAYFDRDVKPGVGIGLVSPDTWATIHDPSSGWIYIGASPGPNANHYVEFADNTVAALIGDRLVSLWLRPRIDAS